MTRLSFFIGTGRCGSSLIHEVIARHPDVGFISNINDLTPWRSTGRWNSAVYRATPPSWNRKGRLRFAPSEAYRLSRRLVGPLLAEPFRDLTAADATPWLAARLRAMFEPYIAAQRPTVFLHKFTGWPRSGLLDATFESPTFVNIVRDGRAVANSLLQMPWWTGHKGPEAWGWGTLSAVHEELWERYDRSIPVLAGIEWKILMEAFEVARAKIDPARWLDIRYEDFISEPAGVAERILHHLDLRWDKVFESHLGRYSFSSSRKEAFREDLGPLAARQLTEALRPTLKRWGYSA